MPFTNYLADQLRRHVFGTATFAKPPAIHIALFTTLPNAAGVGGVEVATLDAGEATGYGRVQRNPGDANWTFPASPAGEASNSADIQYAAPLKNWGLIVGMGAYDAAAAGNLLAFNALANTRNVNAGDAAPRFAANTMKAIFKT